MTTSKSPKVRSPALRFLPETMHVGRQLRTYCDARFKTIGLTLARGQVLLHLEAAQGRLPQSELTSLLDVEHPTAIRLIDSLQALGYVQRSPGEQDRRSKDIVLTDAGTSLANEVRVMTDEILMIVMQDIPDEEFTVARKVLASISTRLATM